MAVAGSGIGVDSTPINCTAKSMFGVRFTPLKVTEMLSTLVVTAFPVRAVKGTCQVKLGSELGAMA